MKKKIYFWNIQKGILYIYLCLSLTSPPTPSHITYTLIIFIAIPKKNLFIFPKKIYTQKNEILADQKASLLCDCLKIFVSKNGNSFDPLSRDYKIMKDSRTNKNIKLKMKFGEKKIFKFHF